MPRPDRNAARAALDPPPPRLPDGRARLVTAAFGAATVLLAAASIRWATPVSVIGLAFCGMAHVVLELRYVVGRFAPINRPTLGWAIVAILSFAALSRILGVMLPGVGSAAEIGIAYALLALMAVLVLRRRTALIVIAVAVPLAVACMIREDWYLCALTHAHNAVPLIFLWDWSRRISSTARRRAFMAVQCLWALVVPLVFISGALDAWISTEPGIVSTWSSLADLLTSSATPPGSAAGLEARYLACFAFTHSMHYVVWVAFLPWAAPEINTSFDRAIPRLRRWRVPVLALVTGAILLVLFVMDSRQGNQLYSTLAAYHVYVEIPAAMLLICGPASASTGEPARPRLGMR